MGPELTTLDTIRAGLAPHGLFLRGAISPGDDGPLLADGRKAATVLLVGNVGGSLWPAFLAWRETQADRGGNDPLDTWSKEVVGALAADLGLIAWFPSDRPWQPFQRWAFAAEGLKASPLGILIHPDYGLWHGYRAALGLPEMIEHPEMEPRPHPCDTCSDKPCLSACPADAVRAEGFDLASCRAHLKTGEGQAGCMRSGCIARNACPVGAAYRYPEDQLQFHMAALSLPG